MFNYYYDLPLKVKNLMSFKNDLKTCDLRQSIAQNIFLIITTKFNENRFDESYGCKIWDMDFELVFNENIWLETIRKSISSSIVKHETRLCDISVEIDTKMDETITTIHNTKSVKKMLVVFVKASIGETGEYFSFNTSIYLSPLSLD